MRIVLKVGLTFAVCYILIQYLLLQPYNIQSNKSIVRQVFAKHNYKYWSKEDGKLYCSTKLENVPFDILEKFESKKTNVVYLTDVDIANCGDNLDRIALEFHRKNLALAINLESSFEWNRIYGDDFKKFDLSFYPEKFRNYKKINDWVDYIVIDEAMEFMTYEDRKVFLSQLRGIFPKPFMGFRFSKRYYGSPMTTHLNRKDKKLSELLPREDDGDFIIVSFPVSNFRRTSVFIEEGENIKIYNFDGEFIK